MKIGVISDTHNYLDPKIPGLFKGVEHILHAGDIGLPRIILDLESIAPVTAVLGNNDDGLEFRETEVVELAGRKFLVHHIVDVQSPSDALKQQLSRHSPDVVIFGHSHKPFNQMLGTTLYFNPGYAGKPRFSLERTVATLHCNKSNIRVEYHQL
jgi:putative phosphoesterase